MSQSYPKKLGYGFQENRTPEIPFDPNFAANQAELRFLVTVIPRTLRDHVISGRSDVDFYCDTKIGLATLFWKNDNAGKISEEEQRIGKWDVSGYEPKLVSFVLLSTIKAIYILV